VTGSQPQLVERRLTRRGTRHSSAGQRRPPCTSAWASPHCHFLAA